MDKVGINHVETVGDERFRRQGERLGLEGRVERVRAQGRAERVDHRLGVGAVDQHAIGQFLDRLVAGEGIVVADRERFELAVAAVDLEDDGGGKAAVDGEQSVGGRAVEPDAVLRLVEDNQPLLVRRAVGADQARAQGDDHRLFVALAGGGGNGLGKVEGRARFVLLQPRGDGRRAGLRIPKLEVGEVAATGVLHGFHEIVASRRFAVVAVEIEVGRLPERVRAQQRVHHANDFRALVIDGRGVEIGDLEVGIGAHRMGERAAVLRKLRGAQQTHVVDALDGRRADVGGKTLVAEDGETFLQTELEPVAAGDAIARPVVKIFVRDDAGDGVEIAVGRGVGVGQHEARVEDVEALVLHRAEIEIGHRDDVEPVEVIFAAVDALVPGHRLLEAFHGVTGLGKVRLAHPDAELDLAAAHGREGVGERGKVARDQRE